jgi:hypothetical protein
MSTTPPRFETLVNWRSTAKSAVLKKAEIVLIAAR